MKLIDKDELMNEGTTPEEFIFSRFEGVLSENQALVCCINNEKTDGLGYLLGIATEKERGYIPTFYILGTHNYDEANNWVDIANQYLFKRPKQETFKIVLSSMF